MRHCRWRKDGKIELQHIREWALSHGGKRLKMFAYAILNFYRHTEPKNIYIQQRHMSNINLCISFKSPWKPCLVSIRICLLRWPKAFPRQGSPEIRLGMNEILDMCAQGGWKPTDLGPSRVVQCLRLDLPMQEVWGRPLVRELRSLTPRGQTPRT